jgi:hypothetical protein
LGIHWRRLLSSDHLLHPEQCHPKHSDPLAVMQREMVCSVLVLQVVQWRAFFILQMG